MSWKYLVYILLGYLSGSVLYAYLIPQVLLKKDIRKDSADENPGVANAFKNGGIAVGILCLILELLKGALPVWLGTRELDLYHPLFSLVMLAPVLGHGFPIFFGFKGGKSICVSFGVMLGLLPVWQPLVILIVLYLLFSLVIVIEPHFYRTVVTFICFSIGNLLLTGIPSVICGCILISISVIGVHYRKYSGERISFRFL